MHFGQPLVVLLSRAPASFVIPADIETIPLYVLELCILLPLLEFTFGLMKKASAPRASRIASRNRLNRTILATSKGLSLMARPPFSLAWSKPRFSVYDLVSRHAVPTFFCRRISRRAVNRSSMDCVRFILFHDQKEGCRFFQVCLHSRWFKEVLRRHSYLNLERCYVRRPSFCGLKRMRSRKIESGTLTFVAHAIDYTLAKIGKIW